MKVKVGPITAQYKGTAKLAEVDEATHRIVIDASGRDTRGPGQRQGDDRRHDGRRRRRHARRRRHRPLDHRQGRAVRPGRARRRLVEADGAVRREPRTRRARRVDADTPPRGAPTTVDSGAESTTPARPPADRLRARPNRSTCSRSRAHRPPSALIPVGVGRRGAVRRSGASCGAPAATDASPATRDSRPRPRDPRSAPRASPDRRIEPVFDPAGPVLGIDPGLSRCGYGVGRTRARPDAGRRVRRHPHRPGDAAARAARRARRRAGRRSSPRSGRRRCRSSGCCSRPTRAPRSRSGRRAGSRSSPPPAPASRSRSTARTR